MRKKIYILRNHIGEQFLHLIENLVHIEKNQNVNVKSDDFRVVLEY